MIEAWLFYLRQNEIIYKYALYLYHDLVKEKNISILNIIAVTDDNSTRCYNKHT